jgi:hypothetical protein
VKITSFNDYKDVFGGQKLDFYQESVNINKKLEVNGEKRKTGKINNSIITTH